MTRPFIAFRDQRFDTHANLDHSFVAYEVNYARTDAIEGVCSEHGIDYRKHNEAGGGYGEDIELYVGGVTKLFPASDGEPMIALSRVLEAETLASGLANLIAEAKFAVKGMAKLEILP
jgi:hypothetical protein